MEVAASVAAREAAAVAVARQGMLSSTRLELPSFPSSTWRSPSPSKSADTIDNVDVLPARCSSGTCRQCQRAATRVERQYCRQTCPLARPRRERKRSRSTPPSRDDDGVE